MYPRRAHAKVHYDTVLEIVRSFRDVLYRAVPRSTNVAGETLTPLTVESFGCLVRKRASGRELVDHMIVAKQALDGGILSVTGTLQGSGCSNVSR